MLEYEGKRDQISRLILSYIAQRGFSNLSRFSHLAKGINKGRSLLYFYFKESSEVIDAVGDIFERELAAHLEHIEEQELDFKHYLRYLTQMKDLVFFTLECQKEVSREPKLMKYLSLVQETIDHYSYQRFCEYYQLEDIDVENVSFMYSCFRSKWWDSLGDYEGWGLDKTEAFFESLDTFMETQIQMKGVQPPKK